MNNPRYPEEFKIEAVKQVTERGLPAADCGTLTRPALSSTSTSTAVTFANLFKSARTSLKLKR
jgi:transposase-like protein